MATVFAQNLESLPGPCPSGSARDLWGASARKISGCQVEAELRDLKFQAQGSGIQLIFKASFRDV